MYIAPCLLPEAASAIVSRSFDCGIYPKFSCKKEYSFTWQNDLKDNKNDVKKIRELMNSRINQVGLPTKMSINLTMLRNKESYNMDTFFKK